MHTIKDKQIETLARLMAEYQERTDLTPGQAELIRTLACVLVEEEDLQGYCNTYGTCYTMTTKSGDQMNRMRPEWQQLKEARHRKQIIITRLENWIGEGKAPVDETAEYFS
jgi:hypothetical protein